MNFWLTITRKMTGRFGTFGQGSKASDPNLTLGAPPDRAARSTGIDPKRTTGARLGCLWKI